MNPRLHNERAVIFQRVDEVFHVSADELLGPSRKADIAWARQVAYYALRLGHWSLAEIGVAMSRDHTSVYHGIGIVERRIHVNLSDARDVGRISTPITPAFDAERCALAEIEESAGRIHEAIRDAVTLLRRLEAEAHTIRISIEGGIQTRGAA